jgi:hypothetical protein
MSVFVTVAALAHAAENANAAKPVLAPDPAVTRILNSLDAGHSALLPPIRTAGDINDVARKYKMHIKGPRGRDYCIKMMWMSDRQRALFCGANHAVPHRLNDVWEYDLPSNTWVCLYAPDNLTSGGKTLAGVWKDVKVDDGVLRTPRGGPAIVGHQWWQTTYDPSTGTMYFNSQWPNNYFGPKIRKLYLDNGRHTLWSFTPATGKWTPIRCKGPMPKFGSAGNKYWEYVPALKGILYADASGNTSGTWFFNPRKNSWKELLPGARRSKSSTSNKDLPHRLGVMAHCPKRGLLVAATTADRGDGRTVQYDVAKNKWTRTGEGPDVPKAHVAHTPCGYDSDSGTLFLYVNKKQTLWGYGVDANKWSKITPKGPLPPARKLVAYFDPLRNAFVINSGRQTWIYRHKKR